MILKESAHQKRVRGCDWFPPPKEILMKRRNPWLIGLLNVLIPGSSHVFVNNEWGRFIPIFFGGIVLLFVSYLLGNAITDIRGVSLPQGLCSGALILVIVVMLFISGVRTTQTRNRETDDAAYYLSKRAPTSRGDQATRMKDLQKARDEGLISSEQYNTRKEDINAKK
jgi:hypothetical protein